MKKRVLLGISILLLFTTTLWAKTTIKVGYLPILDHLPLVVSHAHDQEAFKEVSVELNKFTSWQKMVGALKSGVIDAAFILSPLAMSLHNEGDPIEAILLAHRDGSAITVKAGGNIKSAADLKGKKIAIPDKKSTHLALLSKYLMDHGMTLADVETSVIAPPNMEKAMEQGAIDAFIVAEPFGTKAQASGVGSILVMTSEIIHNHVECIVVVNKNFSSGHTQGVQEWVDSLIRAGQFIDKDKKENGAKAVAQIAANPAYMGHSEQMVIQGLQSPSDRISFGNLNPNLEDFKPIADISKQAGIIENTNLNTFINGSFYNNSKAK